MSQLKRRLERLQRRYHVDRGVCPTGFPRLDKALKGGLPRGAVHEFISRAHAPARTLALRAALQNAGTAGWIVCLDPAADWFPTGISNLGVALRRCLIVRPPDQAASLWTAEQSLRCPAVAAVILSSRVSDPFQLRRLQLAAESGSALLLLLRESPHPGRAAFAATRLQLEPLPSTHDGPTPCRRVRITILKARHAQECPSVLEMEL